MLFADVETWAHFQFRGTGHHVGITYMRLPGPSNAFVSLDGSDCRLHTRPNDTWVNLVRDRFLGSEEPPEVKLRGDLRAALALFNHPSCFEPVPRDDLQHEFRPFSRLPRALVMYRFGQATGELLRLGVVTEVSPSSLRLTAHGFQLGWKEGVIYHTPLVHS